VSGPFVGGEERAFLRKRKEIVAHARHDVHLGPTEPRGDGLIGALPAPSQNPASGLITTL